jgi:hypothetical protein
MGEIEGWEDNHSQKELAFWGKLPAGNLSLGK